MAAMFPIEKRVQWAAVTRLFSQNAWRYRPRIRRLICSSCNVRVSSKQFSITLGICGGSGQSEKLFRRCRSPKTWGTRGRCSGSFGTRFGGVAPIDRLCSVSAIKAMC